MAHSTKVYRKEKVDEWKALLNECATKYKITNNSDRTGEEYVIEWEEPEDRR